MINYLILSELDFNNKSILFIYKQHEQNYVIHFYLDIICMTMHN